MRSDQLCLKILHLHGTHRGGAVYIGLFRECLERFLRSFRGLEELALLGSCAHPREVLIDSLTQAIGYHSGTMKVLGLHDLETVDDLPDVAPADLDASAIQKLHDACPYLQVLVIDLLLRRAVRKSISR